MYSSRIKYDPSFEKTINTKFYLPRRTHEPATKVPLTVRLRTKSANVGLSAMLPVQDEVVLYAHSRGFGDFDAEGVPVQPVGNGHNALERQRCCLPFNLLQRPCKLVPLSLLAL